MLDSFLLVAQQTFVLGTLIAVGFILQRMKVLTDQSIRGMVDILCFIVAPALIVTLFQREFRPEVAKGFVFTLVMTVVLQMMTWLVGALLVREKSLREREGVLRFAVIFGNAGFMGIPLDMAILGDEGGFYGAVYILMFNVISWTVGLYVICGSLRHLNWKILVFNPGLVGCALGAPLLVTSTTLPPIFHEPCRYLSELNTPLAMIVIGYYLGNAKLGAAVKSVRVIWTAFLRLMVAPALSIVILYFIGRRYPMASSALVIAEAAPVAAMTTIFASKFKRDVDASVAVIVISTVASMFTMPVVIGAALWLFGVAK